MNINKICKKNGTNYMHDLLTFLNDYGWDSYSKKDIKLYLFYLAQKFEYISPEKVNLKFAKQMKMTKRRLKNVLLESQLRFGDIGVGAIDILTSLFENNETTYQDLKEGEFRFNIRNPILREQVIDLMEENQMTPDFKNNRNILVMDLTSVISFIKEDNDLDDSDILDEISSNINSNIEDEYKNYLDNLDSEDLTAKDAIVGFLKENIEDRIGETFTQYIFQIIEKILDNIK